MQLGRVVPAVALGVLALTACADQQARAELRELKEWLGVSNPPVVKPTTTVHHWLGDAYTALCNLERVVDSSHPGALIPDSRICPSGNPEHGGPPNPPPWGI